MGLADVNIKRLKRNEHLLRSVDSGVCDFPTPADAQESGNWGDSNHKGCAPLLLLITSRPKSSLFGVWHGKRSNAISTGNKRRIVPHLLSFLILPRFRGNPFYVVQRYETIAIPDVDCHKDLHCSVQKVYSSKSKVINCEQTGTPSVRLSYFDHDLMTVPSCTAICNSHAPRSQPVCCDGEPANLVMHSLTSKENVAWTLLLRASTTVHKRRSLATAKWRQLGNTAHIPFPPNDFASPVHLFSFARSGTVQVILPLSLLFLL
jgi:hypothetical protein